MALSRKRPRDSVRATNPPNFSGKKNRGKWRNRDHEEDPQVVSHPRRDHTAPDALAGGHSVARKRLDPQTRSYFLEIAALVDRDAEGDSEERQLICVQALEESRKKELPLACDSSCSRILEIILLSCDVFHLVQFLLRCSSVAVDMALDPSGSHVMETALKSLARALLNGNAQAEDWYESLELTLSTLCQEVGTNAVDVMCNRYGSHVLRSLLSLLSGNSAEILSEGGPGVKPSRNLADKLGVLTNKPSHGQLVRPKGVVFSNLLKSLADKILESSKGKMGELRTDLHAGPVFQALLKALHGKQEAVVRAIALILDCDLESSRGDGAVLENASTDEVLAAMEDRSSSHLMEVVIQSAPNALYLEIFQRFFRKRLLQLSLHPSANFIVQVLIACVRHEGQVSMIFEELETNFSDLVFSKRSGVIAALLAACGRFHTRQREACRALAVAVNMNRPSPVELVPRLLHLESAAEDGTFSEDLTTFSSSKMSVIGSVILQTILSFPKECSQQFCASIAAMESGNLLHASRDASGSRVLEAFLESAAAPPKHKHRIISKLEGHFAELALHPISCFTVEKSFAAADIKLKEKIASELAPVHADLAKSRIGARISRRCDIAGYTKKPEQWRMTESSKQNTHRAFTELFKSDTEKELDDEPTEAALFVKKEEKVPKTGNGKLVSKPVSKKPHRITRTATSKDELPNERLKKFEAMLRGV